MMKIRWIGQSGYILKDGKTEICIDPYLSNVVDRIAKRGRMVKAPFLPDELKSDVVICTHNHLDHIDIMFICINGKLGNMSVDEAIQLTKRIKPKVGVPTHYGMFESNTENPKNYTSKLACGFEMEYNKEYNVMEVLKNV